MPRRPSDHAAELAEIEAKYEARCDGIKAERAKYGEWLREWVQRRREKAVAGGVPPSFYLAVRRGMRNRPMTEAEADAKQAALLREAREDYLRELQVFDLKTRSLTGQAKGLSRAEVRALARQVVAEIEERRARRGPPDSRGPKPIEVELSAKRRIAELRITGVTVAGIMRETGLSKTVATRLAHDVDGALGRIRSGRY